MNSMISELCSWTDKSINNICLSMNDSYENCLKNYSDFNNSRRLFFIKWNALENLNDMAKSYALNNYDSFKKSKLDYSMIFYECLKKYESNLLDLKNMNYNNFKEKIIPDLDIDYFINDEYLVQKIIEFNLFDAYEYFYNHF